VFLYSFTVIPDNFRGRKYIRTQNEIIPTKNLRKKPFRGWENLKSARPLAAFVPLAAHFRRLGARADAGGIFKQPSPDTQANVVTLEKQPPQRKKTVILKHYHIRTFTQIPLG